MYLCGNKTIAKPQTAAQTAFIKNIFDGENLSVIFKKAKLNVPAIKPNCTTDVIVAREFSSILKS